MTRSPCALALATLVAACGGDADPGPRLGARITLDRSETQVGEPIGVTVEIETPAGYAVQMPPAPSGGPFASDSVERVEPIEVPGGLRHHLRWTLRAREIGDQVLPWLEVPLLRPDGAVQPLRVGGVPLAVHSVRADFPSRAAIFDIRAAPPPPPTPLWVWAASAAGLTAAFLLGRRLRARQRAAQARSSRLTDAAHAALAALEGVEADADARSFATRVRAALLGFVGAAWSVDTQSATPGELPPPVDREVVRILHGLELARFAPRPVLAAIRGLAGEARERVRHVANLRA